MGLKLKYKIDTSQGCDVMIYESTFTKTVFKKLCFADMGMDNSKVKINNFTVWDGIEYNTYIEQNKEQNQNIIRL